jgi:hypothetical protein
MFRVAIAAGLVACTPGDAPPGGPRDDAAVMTSGDARADARMLQWVDAAPGQPNNLPCRNFNSPVPQNGHHNTGQSCFQGCHNHGFTLAGTLYTNATGNTGFGGAWITIIDANNVTKNIPVHSNGNFYTSEAIAFPVLTFASSCPSAVMMNTESPNGNCNAGNCHPGASQQQIHLP